MRTRVCMNQIQQPRERERSYRSHLGKRDSACDAGSISSATHACVVLTSRKKGGRIVEILGHKSDRSSCCVRIVFRKIVFGSELSVIRNTAKASSATTEKLCWSLLKVPFRNECSNPTHARETCSCSRCIRQPSKLQYKTARGRSFTVFGITKIQYHLHFEPHPIRMDRHRSGFEQIFAVEKLVWLFVD